MKTGFVTGMDDEGNICLDQSRGDVATGAICQDDVDNRNRRCGSIQKTVRVSASAHGDDVKPGTLQCLFDIHGNERLIFEHEGNGPAGLCG